MTTTGTGSGQSVESLILKATNPLNTEHDPNIIQCVCHSVGHEAGGIQTAVRLLIHKMQSPQEREATQSLLVLQACVNNCGAPFQAEIGKFRFLNEMIKLVSPKYLGTHTPLNVKKRVIELLYTWTVDLPDESKIQEAYAMLKKQGVVKDDPAYLGVPSNIPAKLPQPCSLEDDEKSRTLQRLLQSTRPEDVIKANALIKRMVKDDERKFERTSRRTVEVETSLNNVKVLDEMLNHYEESGSVSEADLELMAELNTSCVNLRSNIHRIVSEMDGKDDDLGDLIKACDELFRVMGRYKLLADVKSKDKMPGFQSDIKKTVEEDTLLDLLQSPAGNVNEETMVHHSATEGCELPGGTNSILLPPGKQKKESILDELGSIFSTGDTASKTTNSPTSERSMNLLLPDPLMPPPMIPQKNVYTSATDHNLQEKGMGSPFNDLDLLGSTLLQKSLPQDIPRIGPQFKAQEKISLNQMKQSMKTLVTSSHPTTDIPLLDTDSEARTNVNDIDKLGKTLDDVSMLSSSSKDSDKVLFDVELEAKEHISAKNVTRQISSDDLYNERAIIDTLSSSYQSTGSRRSSKSGNLQLSEVKPMNDLKVSLEDIKPGKKSPMKLIECNGVNLTLHFTDNKPRDDVSIIVISVSSVNSQPVSNYNLQAVVTKGCKVRLMPPSSTSLCEYSPFLPPPAITQIMLVANPNQLNVSLKVMLSYCINEDPCSDMGEVETLPL